MNMFTKFGVLRRIVLIFIAIVAIPSLYAQDIYDKKHSKKYANFLFMSTEYRLAVNEFERVVFMDKDDEEAKLHLLKSYRLSQQYDKGLKRSTYFYPFVTQMPQEIFIEYAKMLLLTKSFTQLDALLNLPLRLSSDNLCLLKSASCISQANWRDAENYVSKIQESNEYYKPLSLLVQEGKNINYKSPLLSGALSALVPGMGKVYLGYWRDGLLALLATGVSSWQSYRGFNKEGISSVYGWIYGCLSVGLYIGNVYGSVKAANKYNYVKNHEIRQRIEKVYINH